MTDTTKYRGLLKQLKKKSGQDQISCEFCMREIVSCTYISCSECTVAICVACYCLGKEKAGHLRTHRYRVIDSLKFPLFIPEWTAKEERLLLLGVLKYGFGNWGSISDHLGRSKNPRQCELHYRQIYLTTEEISVISERDFCGFVIQRECANPPPYPMDTEDAIFPTTKSEPDKHALMEFAGYMPLRKDFEVEYENDIEMYLADLEFYDDDREEDRTIKFRQLNVYNKVLDEREERKIFVIERWQTEIKNEKHFRGDTIRRNIYHAMKPYARFLPAEQHLALCNALVKEHILRIKLEELMEARKQGFRTEAEFKQFLNERRNNNPARQKEYDILLKEEFETKTAETKWRELLARPDAEGAEAERLLLEEYRLKDKCQLKSLEAIKEKISENISHSMEVQASEADPGQLDLIDFGLEGHPSWFDQSPSETRE
mmetsp:Transcript_18471/g.33259  ORF Transcript_18471/g.33259 Transcript_18471/m.33259 type:complete len:431 (-) Transcript_18471:1375-2667(-)|eukprot:CAMPEP_0204897986 /NCGR_PEP_ID=MMETSP1397-20131031/1028_1 /ASSEMBLY_ACC=CAM_ASM_000891 /TAXON_ID=49980 /ORGANISM="Climacostomum Climacostomum virens, Strain Stock W-24" /LENGTH=430 /DNA_ID=CAMNT_0052065773 /DNA_START=818 /DNA_END=2110 /DNA_ORIENTATION=+